MLRKMITEERGQLTSTDFKYFFYVTNDLEMTQAEVVTESICVASRKNISQLKTGVRALHAPLNTLNANWAYMVIASWLGRSRRGSGCSSPHDHRRRRKPRHKRILTMAFRSFVNRLILIPAQILVHGRALSFSLARVASDVAALLQVQDSL
ncbi:MAG: hypothetical protein R3B89_28435 [Polyangiaceae bacterium]